WSGLSLVAHRLMQFGDAHAGRGPYRLSRAALMGISDIGQCMQSGRCHKWRKRRTQENICITQNCQRNTDISEVINASDPSGRKDERVRSPANLESESFSSGAYA